ncbi:MAG: DUF1566 domain-containing protein [Nitrospirae bacterium]|nr:DUF1566 domain-containing protein [Nitrospirota bacterium]
MGKKVLFWTVVACVMFQTAVWAGTVRLPDTGQTDSFTNTFGEDSDYTINPPSLVHNTNNTVTDINTGLVWQDEDDSNVLTWEEALAYCEEVTLAGYLDWRLPTKKELVSIIDFGRAYPAADTNIFPNTKFYQPVKPYDYWSSSEGSDNLSGDAYYVGFGVGTSGIYRKSFRNYARCVRGGEYPGSSFTNNGNGTVTDDPTGLMWQQTEGGSLNWESALSYCEGLSLGGYSDWRLPNIKELDFIAETTRYNPAVNAEYFPFALSAIYWSATTRPDIPSEASCIDFSYGTIGHYPKSDSRGNVRCVRGGLSGSFDTNCTAALTSGLILHVPVIDYSNGVSYVWADLKYESSDNNEIVFRVTSAGAANPADFYNCQRSTLASDFKLHIPDINYISGTAYLSADFELKSAGEGGIFFKVTGYVLLQ